MYTALYLSTLRICDCFVAVLAHNQRLAALFQHKLFPGLVAGKTFQVLHLVNHNREFIFTAQLTVSGHKSGNDFLGSDGVSILSPLPFFGALPSACQIFLKTQKEAVQSCTASFCVFI